MLDNLAIIYAPGVKDKQIQVLKKKLLFFLESLGFEETSIWINPVILDKENEKTDRWNTLIIGWGLPSKPDWNGWIKKNRILKNVRQFWAIDLFERQGIDGRILNKPIINAGKYWSKKNRQRKQQLFLKGYFIMAIVPYGMKRVPKIEKTKTSQSSNLLYVLDFGEPEKVEIVRLIFNMFVYQNYKRTKIANLLNAQNVTPPNNAHIWNTKNVSMIIENPVYIGANQYSGSIRYNVFPSVLNKSTFFEAQARIMSEKSYRNVSHIMHR